MPRLHEHNNFIFLLSGLLVVILLGPLTHAVTPMQLDTVTSISFVIMLLLGVWSIKGSRRALWFGAIMAVAGIISNMLAIKTGEDEYRILGLVTLFLFLLQTIILAARAVLAEKINRSNGILGAVCVYLLLGVLWSLLYGLIETAIPGSFNGVTLDHEGSHFNDLLYFSFVTLTTLGYGDISPAKDVARVFVYLEAIVGQFYLAVLVAGLVGSYLSEKQTQPPDLH